MCNTPPEEDTKTGRAALRHQFVEEDRARLDRLSGDITALRGSIESLVIAISGQHVVPFPGARKKAG